MINMLLFIFLGTLGWGVSLYLIKILLASLTSIDLVLYRALIGTLSLFLLAKFLRLKIINFRALLWDGLIVGIFNMALPCYLTTEAEKTVSTSLAAVINGMTPLFSFLLGYFFFANKQNFNFFNFLSVLLGLLGVILINYDALHLQAQILGVMAMIGTAFSYGLAANYVKVYSKTQDPILIAGMAAAVSLACMLLFKLGTNDIHAWSAPNNLGELAALFWLGIVSTGLCLYIYCLLIKRIGAFKASMVTYLITVTSVLMGVVLLAETMSAWTWSGCVCIIISLLAVNHANELHRFTQNLFSRNPKLIEPECGLSSG